MSVDNVQDICDVIMSNEASEISSGHADLFDLV